MALKDQPYIPLYVQDVLTDEKLIECSAQAQGVYFRLLCVLHKQENYGMFLLRQKFKQTPKQVENFATALVRPLALSQEIILASLEELLEEEVLYIDGDFLCQKRMIKDAEISDTRANAGRKGGKKTSKKNKDFANNFATAKTQANRVANSEYENEYESVNKYEDININIDKYVIFKREENFKKTIEPFLEKYGKEMCNAFYLYWTEPDKAKRKLRFEMEKTWDVSRRLASWSNNQIKFNKNNNSNSKSFKHPYVDKPVAKYEEF